MNHAKSRCKCGDVKECHGTIGGDGTGRCMFDGCNCNGFQAWGGDHPDGGPCNDDGFGGCHLPGHPYSDFGGALPVGKLQEQA